MPLNNASLESLLEKGKQLEKNYEWLQASKCYKLGAEIALKKNDASRATELMEKIGFCYYRSAFQAKTNRQFRDRLTKSISQFKNESKILEGVEEKRAQLMKNHAVAMIAYVQSWYELNPKKRKLLLDKWWKIEKQILVEYEKNGDHILIGKTCNDLIEYSNYNRFWLASRCDRRKEILKEGMRLAEKAIQIFSNLNNEYELARAYCFASWYYSFVDGYWESSEKILEFLEKSQSYAIKALELSQKTTNAWLIGWSYISAWNAAQFYNLNPSNAMEYGQKALKFGIIARDNFLMGFGNCLTSSSATFLTGVIEDPDKQKENLTNAIRMVRDGTKNFLIIDHALGLLTFYAYGQAFTTLAQLEPDPDRKQTIIDELIKMIQKAIKKYGAWHTFAKRVLEPLGNCLLLKSEMTNDLEEKKQILIEAEKYLTENIAYKKEQITYHMRLISKAYYLLSIIQSKLAKIEQSKLKKTEYYNNAISSMERCIFSLEKKGKLYEQSGWASGFFFGKYQHKLGELFRDVYLFSKQIENLNRAIEAFKNAIQYYAKADMVAHIAESYWHLAQIYDQLNEPLLASKNYNLAAKTYKITSKRISPLRQFYEEHSKYMDAWSQIEKAKYAHSINDYEKSKTYYKKAAELHEKSEFWTYLASNYFAWASMEEAENLSHKENAQQAKQKFQKAYEQFCNSEESIRKKLEENLSLDEKEMNQRLLEASDVRQKYCQSRILLEDAKLLDRQGKSLQSSKSYRKATQNIRAIITKIDVETERKELEYLAILCRAWEKMAIAEETTSSEPYMEAALLFEKAKEYCFTKKASLWALGNSNFCKGLAAGLRYKSSMDLKENALAKRYINDAAASYQQAGFENASEYARATLRLFDAYVFMNQAEGEVDPEKKAKQYQMAENLLQIAAGSFMKAKQPEKTSQVQGILSNVREEKSLAVSLSQVMQAPTIASSTLSFAAPTPTSEVSVGLESFEHANVQANLVTELSHVKIGESFCLSVEFVNAGREAALLLRVNDFIPRDFVVVKKPEIYRIEQNTLNMKGKQLAPLKLVEVKLTLQPSKKGAYKLNPKVQYLDERGQNKSLQLKTLEIQVEEVIMEDRVSTGTPELDSLLLGGIPKEYAIALAGPPCDEREMMIKNFLKTGIKKDETTFYIATETTELTELLNKPNFFLFLCNPQPKTEVPDLPNVYRLQSKTDITNLGIVLTKAYRNIDQSSTKKRVCVEIISDVLVNQGIKITRDWISGLITDLGAKGFTMLAVINPTMHPPDQANAVLDLFDGEISITQSDDPLDCKKSILVKKLRNQDYIKNPICLR